MVGPDWLEEMGKIMGGGGTVVWFAVDSISVLMDSQIRTWMLITCT